MFRVLKFYSWVGFAVCLLAAVSASPSFGYVFFDLEVALGKKLAEKGLSLEWQVEPWQLKTLFQPEEQRIILLPVLPGANHQKAIEALEKVELLYPSLAQFLTDMTWSSNDELIELLDYLLSNPDAASFLNENKLIKDHVAGSVLDKDHLGYFLIAALLKHRSLQLVELLQTAPQLAYFLLDSPGFSQVRKMLPLILSSPGILAYLQQLEIVQSHQFGTPAKRANAVFYLLYALQRLGAENSLILAPTLQNATTVEQLVNLLHEEVLDVAFADLEGWQMAVIANNSFAIQFFFTITGMVGFTAEEVTELMTSMAEYLNEEGLESERLQHLTVREILLLLIKRRYASEINYVATELGSLVSLMPFMQLPVIDGLTPELTFFLLMRYQNILACLQGLRANFRSINAAASFIPLNQISQNNGEGVSSLLQQLINNPEQVATIPSDPDALEVLITSGLGALSSTQETQPLDPQELEEIRQLSILQIVESYFPLGHPAHDALIEFAHLTHLEGAELNTVLQAANFILNDMQLSVPPCQSQVFNRNLFMIRLIAQLMAEGVKPFGYAKVSLIRSKASRLFKNVASVLSNHYEIPIYYAEFAAAGLLHLMSAYPQIFSLLGSRQVFIEYRSHPSLYNLLSRFDRDYMEHVIRVLLIHPSLWGSAQLLHQQGGNLGVFTQQITEVEVGHLPNLTVIQSFLLHAVLMSASQEVDLTGVEIPELLVAEMEAILQEHLEGLWLDVGAIDIRRVIGYLLEHYPSLKDAKNRADIEDLFSRQAR